MSMSQKVRFAPIRGRLIGIHWHHISMDIHRNNVNVGLFLGLSVLTRAKIYMKILVKFLPDDVWSGCHLGLGRGGGRGSGGKMGRGRCRIYEHFVFAPSDHQSR